MPAIQHWFTASALFLAGATAISFVGTVLGLRGIIEGRFVNFLWLAALIVFAIGWYSAAKQERDSEARDAQARETHSIVASLADRLSINSDASTVEILKKIEKQLRPRRIDPDDRKAIVAALARFSHVPFMISALSQDRETISFAYELRDTLREAGWQGQVANNTMPGIVGVVISRHTAALSQQIFQAMTTAFANAGISLNDDISGNSFAGGGMAEIFVGPKP